MSPPVELRPLPSSAANLQGRGIGTRLLVAAENATRLPRAALFTGALSGADLRLYGRLGYTESSREDVRPGLRLVHLAEALPGAQR
ncbi:GNAT family N-acetyltransferase [Blastococcus sp. LR1]|uniref:GNAT family N-acetyltransferase n=1 Tax=Blastococcus sp. LR1 TaxID=2877000 RepID=UPI001CCEEAF2|nr:GNAT family N-acetyltransferase [Blastococcus sp. LR1]MCA0146602.1 GNAT family N-acetyltransferase [Blastococcus sp. LR1]